MTRSGEDLALLKTFYRACNLGENWYHPAEGGIADEIHLRGIRAALAAHPTPQPVAVSERPWEKETGWLDLDGECWWCPPDGTPYWSLANPAMVYGGWVLPANALPIPKAQP